MWLSFCNHHLYARVNPNNFLGRHGNARPPTTDGGSAYSMPIHSNPARLVLAVPVALKDTLARLRSDADETVCLETH